MNKMHQCDLIIKNKNIDLPDKEFILNSYNQLKRKYITSIYNNGHCVFIDKECETINPFLEDFYKDVNKEDISIIIFHNEKDGYYTNLSEKFFYRTNHKVAVSRNQIIPIECLLTLNKEKFSPLFNMFLDDNLYIELSINSICLYGNFYKHNGILTSFEIKQNKETIKDLKLLDVTFLCDWCNNVFSINKMHNEHICINCHKKAQKFLTIKDNTKDINQIIQKNLTI